MRSAAPSSHDDDGGRRRSREQRHGHTDSPLRPATRTGNVHGRQGSTASHANFVASIPSAVVEYEDVVYASLGESTSAHNNNAASASGARSAPGGRGRQRQYHASAPTGVKIGPPLPRSMWNASCGGAVDEEDKMDGKDVRGLYTRVLPACTAAPAHGGFEPSAIHSPSPRRAVSSVPGRPKEAH